ncbi:DUF4231 domain-containing protein [Streptomyces acidicola]|uniref:DUF4231 domain-containing protein n=1 Tax=Streptomyces acidicola TaxID=2596892 RepID=UPI00342AEAC5
MNERGGHTVAAKIWDEQSSWSQAANRLKTTITRARTLALALGTAGAILGTASSQIMGEHKALGQALAFVAALAAGTVPLLAARMGPTAVQQWTRLRSMSEAIKNEVYVYLAGVSPYRGPAPEVLLRERVDRLHCEVTDLLPFLTGIAPASRALPAVTEIDSYVNVRLKGQITGYYRPKALKMGRRLTTVRRVEFAIGGAGAALGALAGALGIAQAAAWVAVAAVTAAAVSAHSTASKYVYQQVEFVRTADELERLLGRWSARSGRTEQSDDEFVRRCEDVISVLNESWMVKWSTE